MLMIMPIARLWKNGCLEISKKKNYDHNVASKDADNKHMLNGKYRAT